MYELGNAALGNGHSECVGRQLTSLSVAHVALYPLPRVKCNDLFHHVDASRRLLLLLLSQLAPNSGKRFPQISFHTLRVTERRIEDRLHLTSTSCAMNASPHFVLDRRKKYSIVS